MTQKHWAIVVPVLLFVGIGGRMFWNPETARGGDRRVINRQFLALEQDLGYHLYAPTWLPRGGSTGYLGTLKGQYRILQDFVDAEGQALALVAQERRTAARDAYHRRIFVGKAEATTTINDATGYLTTGSSGERRLFWNEPQSAVIISSSVLTDDELVAMARKVE